MNIMQVVFIRGLYALKGNSYDLLGRGNVSKVNAYPLENCKAPSTLIHFYKQCVFKTSAFEGFVTAPLCPQQRFAIQAKMLVNADTRCNHHSSLANVHTCQ